MNRFADEAVIEVSSGKGGNGCAAFRREKFVPKGGPAGGDGGRGGDVVFTVRQNLRTLYHLRYKHTFKAENGHDGEGRSRYGKNGENVVIPVPPGAVIFDEETRERIHDFSKDSADFVFLRGGNGGWGNIHFKSSTNQAPQIAYSGKDGETRLLRVELQIMADIGFVGFPNAGKSSLLDAFTNARPKIAPYPFTTKIPNLGVFRAGGGAEGGGRDIILADIPGLIEGASEGAGLGFQFLKHISRAAALAFLIDLSADGYLEAYEALCAELGAYDSALLKKKRLIVGTKLDEEGARENLEALTRRHPNERVLGVSVYSRTGLNDLAAEMCLLCNENTDD
ncbi:MAG: GTPase ObgE [Spirochaetaceae bacterium]|jgi:GTP-binding protein|nr:GTPase ObgE [Spirochaetaceae bacterium]